MFKGFYIQISNGLLKDNHRKRMGESVWEFMWCLDRITRIDDNGDGWVLGGKPIQLKNLAQDLGVHEVTVSRNLTRLKTEGYIETEHTPYGIRIKVRRAKKSIKPKGGKVVDNLGIKKERFNTNAARFNINAKPNIRQYSDNTRINNNGNRDQKPRDPKARENLARVEAIKKKIRDRFTIK